MLSTLKHCAALVRQADETRGAKLKAEKERCRVLEEALAVLAAEHHDLEQSFVEQLSEHQVSCIALFSNYKYLSIKYNINFRVLR